MFRSIIVVFFYKLVKILGIFNLAHKPNIMRHVKKNGGSTCQTYNLSPLCCPECQSFGEKHLLSKNVYKFKNIPLNTLFSCILR
jgi:hypothetical protein